MIPQSFWTLMFCVASMSLVKDAISVLAVERILSANAAATRASSLRVHGALQVFYNYSGQGLKGTTTELYDLQRARYVARYDYGIIKGAQGYDGARAWEQEPSGTATYEAGGDVLALAINTVYRARNIWWQRGYGGATIVIDAEKMENGQRFEVLSVTPLGGKRFEAWFDSKTHLLARLIQMQDTLEIDTHFLEYKPVDGLLIASRISINDGTGKAGVRTMHLTAARFLRPQPASTYSKPAIVLHDFGFSHGSHESTVPFRLINNHIYVAASVNGCPPRLFLLDTGGYDTVTPVTADALHLRVVGRQSTTGTGSNIVQSGFARVASITVGAATVVDQPVSVLAFDNAAEGVDEQGMIGYEFLARFITRIDYPKREITFSKRADQNSSNVGVSVRFVLFHQLPVVAGSYAHIPATFGVDTGSRGSLGLTGPFVATHQLHKRGIEGVTATTGWGIGGESRGFVTRGTPLMLDSVLIGSPVTDFSADEGGSGGSPIFPNIVGGGILKRFIVTLDYAHYTMFLKQTAEPKTDLDSYDRSGMWINQEDGFSGG